MSEDTTPPTDNNVVEFNKRFSAPPPKPIPIWHITFINERTKDGEVNHTIDVPGYIFSHMPYFVITDKEISRTEQGLDSNAAKFVIPSDRLVFYERVERADAT